MVKVDSLSSDIDFIKEFEELKIKQKLLIESLKKKTKTEQGKIFLEINSKLDFLVKIFTEANKTEEENKVEEEEKKLQITSIVDKIDELSKSLDEKFEKIDKSIEKIEKEVHSENKEHNLIHKTNNNNNNNNLSMGGNDIPTASELKKQTNTLNSEGKSIENLNSKNNDMPPAPDFESRIETINNETSSSTSFKFGSKIEEGKDEIKKKSKKWF